MNCTCTPINGLHAANCPMTGSHSHSINYVYTPSTTIVPSVYTNGLTTTSDYSFSMFRSNKEEPEFEDVKVEKRWDQLKQFGLELPSNNLTRDLEEKKRILLQRGVHLREVVAQPDLGENIYKFIAATEGTKRDGNTLVNSGWNFNNFSKNPVFLFQHDYSQLPIGQHLKWEIDDKNNLIIYSRFVTADIYPFAERVRLMYEKGFLRAVSIGWIPLDYEPVRNEEGIQTGWKFLKNELLEVSAVSVPADPDAIIQGVNQRILEPSDLEIMATYIDSVRQFRNIAHIISNIDSVVRTEVEEVTPEVETTINPDDVLQGMNVDEVVDEVTEPEAVQEASEVISEPALENPQSEIEDLEAIARHAKVILNGLLFPGERGYEGIPYSERRLEIYGELTKLYEKLGRKIPSINVVEHVYKCNRELYRRRVAFLDRFENATDSQLIEGLLYTGAEYPDDLNDVLNSVRDAVDQINDASRTLADEVQQRVGSKISKNTKDMLKKCESCLDEAKGHLHMLMGDEHVDNEPNDYASSVEPEVVVTHEAPELDVVAERAAALARRLSGQPEPEVTPEVSIDEIAERALKLKRNLVKESAGAVSETSKSKYIRELLKNIIDSEE